MKYVAELMVKDLYTLKRNDSLKDVRKLMELAKIRHVPVVDSEQNFIGLISNRDLLACTISKLADISDSVQNEIDAEIRVDDVMRTDLVCAEPEMLLKEAAEILYRYKYGCLPVLNGKKLVGIVTEADFLRLAIILLNNE